MDVASDDPLDVPPVTGVVVVVELLSVESLLLVPLLLSVALESLLSVLPVSVPLSVPLVSVLLSVALVSLLLLDVSVGSVVAVLPLVSVDSVVLVAAASAFSSLLWFQTAMPVTAAIAMPMPPTAAVTARAPRSPFCLMFMSAPFVEMSTISARPLPPLGIPLGSPMRRCVGSDPSGLPLP